MLFYVRKRSPRRCLFTSSESFAQNPFLGEAARVLSAVASAISGERKWDRFFFFKTNPTKDGRCVNCVAGRGQCPIRVWNCIRSPVALDGTCNSPRSLGVDVR